MKYSNISGSYCGSYDYYFNDTNNTNTSISSLSQNVINNSIVFSPTAQTQIFKTQNVTFFAYLVDYPTIISNATFNITTLGYTPPAIPSYTYYVNSTQLSFSFDDFTLLPSNFSLANATDLTTANIQLFVYNGTKPKLSVPLDFDKFLVPLGSSFAASWLNFNPDTRFLNFTVKDEKFLGHYQIVVAKNFPNLQNPTSGSGYGQFAFTTFSVDVLTLPPPKGPTTPPFF